MQIAWISDRTESASSPETEPLVIDDRTPPELVSSNPLAQALNVPSNSVISITIEDKNSGINTANYTLQVSTDNINAVPAFWVAFNNNTLNFIPQNNFHYNDPVFVTLNFADKAGNTTVATFDFRIEMPPAPDAPELRWDNENEFNTSSDQRIVVSLNQTIPANNGITHWKIYEADTTENYATVDITADHYIFTGVGDNTSLSLQIAWFSESANTESEKSPSSAELVIGDRTPPEAYNINPDQIVEIFPGITPNFDTDFYDYSGLTDNLLSLEAETQAILYDTYSGQTTYAPPVPLAGSVYLIDSNNGYQQGSVRFEPTDSGSLGTKVSVTINIYDNIGNNTVITRSWLTTAELPIPDAPQMEWLHSQNYNTTDNQTVRIYRPPTTNKELMQEWNIKYRLTNAYTYEEINSLSITTLYYDLAPVSDNQTIAASVYWLLPGSALMTSSSENNLQLADRTPPVISSEPADTSANVPVNTYIYVYFIDHSEILSSNIQLAVTINGQEIIGNYLSDFSTYNSGYEGNQPLITYRGRLNLGQALNYDNAVSIQLSAPDAAGNSSTYNFSFSTPQDTTPPEISSISTGNYITSPIYFYIMDQSSGVNFDTLRVSVNAHNLDLERSNSYITVRPSPDPLYYGETVFVTISAADYTGNQLVCTFSYLTEFPPTPFSRPAVEWVNGSDKNTTDNQLLRITRQATINNYLEEWELNVSSNGQIIYTGLYPVALASAEIIVSDNQTIQASMRWLDTDTNAYSPYGQLSQELKLEDRTPPTLDLTTLSPRPGSSNVSVTADISFYLSDPEGNLQSVSLYKNDNYFMPHSDDGAGNYIYENNFNYNDTIRITLNALDQQNNQLTVTYSFATQKDDLKPEIKISAPLNGGIDLDPPLTLNFSVTDLDSGISLNSLEILLNDAALNRQTGVTAATPNGFQLELPLNASFNTEYNLTINAADNIGNRQTATINFTTRKTAFHILEDNSYHGSIQKAADHAERGWTLEIEAGEYTEINIILSKDLTISGNVTLNAQGQGRHFRINNAQVTLNRINLINGYGDYGGSIYLNESGLKIYDAVISGNIAQYSGGAIYRYIYSSLELYNTLAYGNRAVYGAFAATGSGSNPLPILIKNSILTRHSGESLFHFYSESTGRLNAARTDFIYNHNTAVSSTPALFFGGAVTLENCTVYGNTAENQSLPSIYNYNTSNYIANFTALNSILWDNSAPMFALDNQKTAAIHSNIQPDNLYTSVNSFSAAPGFVNTANNDFRLTSVDLGIDRGTDNVSLADGKLYEHLDIGSHEYAGLFIGNIQPEAGSRGNQISPTLSFIIHDATNGITSITDITNITVTINTSANSTVYHQGDLLLSLLNNTLKAELNLGNIGAGQTVNFSIAAEHSAGSSYETPAGEFYTRGAAFRYLVFDPPTASVLASNELLLKVQALDDNRDPIGGQEINFNFYSANPGGAAFQPDTVLSGSGGWAQTKLQSGGSENITLEILAWSEGISSNVLTVTVNPLLRIVKNLNLNTEYISVRAAFEDNQLAEGQTLEISSNYALAEPAQKDAELTWPNKNNLTLKAAGLTINSRIKISGVSGLTATLEGLIFDSQTNPLSIDNSGGTVNIVSSIFSNNNGAIYAMTGYLRVESSTFNNNINTASSGGAIYYGANGGGKVDIQRSHFNKNSANSGGALYLNGSALQTIYIGQSSFSENRANSSGSFLYMYANNANLLLENCLIVSNNATAVSLYTFRGATLNFSTLVGNTTAFEFSYQQVSLINSIVWGNTSQLKSSGGTLYGINSLTQTPLTAGLENSSADPLLDADYRLSATDSPAFNKASANFAVNVDYAGSTRPILGGYDIGALELNPGTAVAFVASNKNSYASLQEALDAAAEDDTIIVLAAEIALTAPLSWPSKNITLQGLFQENKIKGDRQIVMIVNTGTGNIQLENLTIASFNNVISQDILVPNSITLNKLLVLDNHADYSTSIGANQQGSVLNTTQVSRVTVLNSLVSGNSATQDGGLFYLNPATGLLPLYIKDTIINNSSSGSHGGVAYGANAVLEQVTINIMRANLGGGAFAYSRVSADRSVFSGGSSHEGGVFYNGIKVSANYSLFKNNSAYRDGSVFGVNNSSQTFVVNIDHSIFHDNQIEYSGATIGNKTNGLINNSVFWHNGDGADFDSSSSKVVINHSAGNKSLSSKGAANLLISDPYFIDPAANNYRVSYNSPLIDSGTGNVNYIYDRPDIGIYEYDGTYLNEYDPEAGTQDVRINSPVTFRVRDHWQNIDPATVSVSLNGVNYTQPTTQVTTSQNTSLTDQTDFYLTFTPSPNFRFNASINVGIAVASIDHFYQFRTSNPKDIYVSAGSGNDTNDGSPELPFQTINKALSIASDDSIIFLDSGTYNEAIAFHGNSNILLVGTTNTVVSGKISVGVGVTINLQNFIYAAEAIENHGHLYIEGLRSLNTANYFVNNENSSVRIWNSTLSNKTSSVVFNNFSRTEIIHSNLVNNTKIFGGMFNGTTETAGVGNSILYHSPRGEGTISLHNNLENIDPLFTDATFTEVAFNSPAVDTADDSDPAWQVSRDIRGLARPEHHRPDIGAWESDKPNIILQQPVSADYANLLITNNFQITVVETPGKISAAQISLSLPMDSLVFTPQSTGYALEAAPSLSYFDTGMTYNLIITAENASGNIARLSVTLNTIPAPQDIYVDAGSSEYEFGFANYPFRSVQNALNYALRKKLSDVTINLVNDNYALTAENILPDNADAVANIIIRAEQGATLDAQQTSRIFNFGTGYNITLQNLTLVNGLASSTGGGAILNNAVLILSNLSFQDNTNNDGTSSGGGAILNNENGLLTIEHSVFRNNRSAGYSISSGGGAIFNKGRVTLNSTAFIENKIKDQSGSGGAIYNKGVLYGADLTISGNTGSQHGGGIYTAVQPIQLERILFRGNTTTGYGGAIYVNNNGQVNLVNSIFDYNSAKDGGAVAYTNVDAASNVYQSSFIRNTASNSSGAIYNANQKANIYNSLFLENTASSGRHFSASSGQRPTLYNCYPADINFAGDPNILSAIDKYDYMPNPAAAEIVDNENSLLNKEQWISSSDFKNKNRTEPYDIGALEYRQSILIARDKGYFAVNSDGGLNEFNADSTVTIYREVAGQWLGAIIIPSSNQMNYEQADFRSLSINANYIDTEIWALSGKTYWLEMFSPDRYPFISANGKVLSDYYGKVTDNDYLTGNAVVTPDVSGNYKLTVLAVNAGKFELVHPTTLNLTPALVVKNFNRASTINIAVRDEYGTPLSEVPVTLSTNGAGSFSASSLNPVTATSSMTFNHPPQEELAAAITGRFAELAATISARTIDDQTAPIITLSAPSLPNSAVTVTQNIIFSAADPESEIATFSFILNDIDRTAELLASANNVYIYTDRLALDTPYSLTINATNNVDLAAVNAFVFQTKTDTDAPDITAYPAPGQTKVPQGVSLSFNIQDQESGLSLNTLTLEVSGNLISPADYSLTANSAYDAQITYTPPAPFELASTISVTLNIEDNLGHRRELTYAFVVITDFRPPTINTFRLTQEAPNTDSARVSISVSDDNSELDPDSIRISINGQIVTPQILSLTTSNKQLTAEFLLTNLGYNKDLQLALYVADACGNTANDTTAFTTAPDLLLPDIQLSAPTDNSLVDISASLLIDLIDRQSGINPLYTVLLINNRQFSYSSLQSSLTVSSDGKSYRLNYQPPEPLEYDTEYRVTITAHDNNNYNGSQGNIRTLTYTFRTIVDIFPPTAPNISPLGYTDTSRALIRITGNKESKSELWVYVNGALELIDTADYNNAVFDLTLNFQNRQAASIDIQVIAQDQAGNTSNAAGVSFNFVDNYQEYSPTLNVLAPAGTFDNEETVALSDVTSTGYYAEPGKALWISSVWELAFSGAANKKMEVTIPLAPEAASYNNLAVYYFDAQEYKWIVFVGNAAQLVANGAVNFETDRPGLYTLGAALNKNATIVENYNVVIAPNPVKLAEGPLHFVYRAPNNCSADLRIYTLSGRLLYKTTKELTATDDFPAEFIWSGENDFNDTIGNGVYIILLTLTDQVTGEKHVIKSKFAVLN
jgi:predicted outer membrane repeat protein